MTPSHDIAKRQEEKPLINYNHGAMTFIIMAIRKMTFSIATLNIMTVSKMTFSIYSSQQNDINCDEINRDDIYYIDIQYNVIQHKAQ